MSYISTTTIKVAVQRFELAALDCLHRLPRRPRAEVAAAVLPTLPVIATTLLFGIEAAFVVPSFPIGRTGALTVEMMAPDQGAAAAVDGNLTTADIAGEAIDGIADLRNGLPHRSYWRSRRWLPGTRRPRWVDFKAINQAALAALPTLLERWLPGGRIEAGREYVARNPRRDDRRLGSFKINLHTGRWADFATGDKGGDVISLAAYLAGMRQIEAARMLAEMLGVRS